MLYKILLIALFSSLLFALTPQEEIQQMKAEFNTMKASQNRDFNDYRTSLNAEFKAYKKELSKYWKNPELSTKKSWVSYSKDKQSRSKVDFAHNQLIVEVIAKNRQEATKKLQKRVSYAISKNTQEVVKSDELQQKIAEISKKSDTVIAAIDPKPILAPLIFKKKPTQKEIKDYSKKLVTKTPIIKEKSKEQAKNVYKIIIKLPKNSTMKRSKIYKDEVFANANRFRISPTLVFAIMQTESDFNPFARSHIPAFGLMQIVPRSAGRDSYKLLYKRDGMPSATYLYNSKNNIEMGSSYLYILYYRYLRKIKNPTSRLYCTIAAYNTGAGNIAWAFVHQTNINKAAPLINTMTPQEVYNQLLSNLKYDEPKYYLKRVSKRMEQYKKAYKL